MARNFSRSSSGCDSSSARASTRALKASHDSSRLLNRSSGRSSTWSTAESRSPSGTESDGSIDSDRGGRVESSAPSSRLAVRECCGVSHGAIMPSQGERTVTPSRRARPWSPARPRARRPRRRSAAVSTSWRSPAPASSASAVAACRAADPAPNRGVSDGTGRRGEQVVPVPPASATKRRACGGRGAGRRRARPGAGPAGRRPGRRRRRRASAAAAWAAPSATAAFSPGRVCTRTDRHPPSAPARRDAASTTTSDPGHDPRRARPRRRCRRGSPRPAAVGRRRRRSGGQQRDFAAGSALAGMTTVQRTGYEHTNASPAGAVRRGSRCGRLRRATSPDARGGAGLDGGEGRLRKLTQARTRREDGRRLAVRLARPATTRRRRCPGALPPPGADPADGPGHRRDQPRLARRPVPGRPSSSSTPAACRASWPRTSIFDVPAVGWAHARMGHIPVKRGTTDARQSLAAAVDALDAGQGHRAAPRGHRHPRPAVLADGRQDRRRPARDARPGRPGDPGRAVGRAGAVDLYRKKVKLIPRPRHVLSVGEPIDLDRVPRPRADAAGAARDDRRDHAPAARTTSPSCAGVPEPHRRALPLVRSAGASPPATRCGTRGTRAAVLGAGSWGTTFAKVLVDAGNDVTLWARRPELAAADQRRAPQRRLPARHRRCPPASARHARRRRPRWRGAELVAFAIPSQTLRENLASWAAAPARPTPRWSA